MHRGTQATILKIDPPFYDLKLAEQYTSYHISFRILNASQEAVDIIGVTSDCVCTSVIPTAKCIEGNSSTSVHATINTSNRTSPYGTTIYVDWVGRKTGTKGRNSFRLRAEPVSLLNIPTHIIDFGDIPFGSAVLIQSLKLTHGGSKTCWNDLLCDSQFVHTEIRKGEDNSYELQVSLDPSQFTGVVRDEINLKLLLNGTNILELVNKEDIESVSRQLEKTILVKARVQDNDILMPPSIWIGTIQKPSILDGHFYLDSLSRDPISVDAITSSLHNCSIEGYEGNNSSRLTVRYRLKFDGLKGVISGTINTKLHVHGTNKLVSVSLIGYFDPDN